MDVGKVLLALGVVAVGCGSPTEAPTANQDIAVADSGASGDVSEPPSEAPEDVSETPLLDSESPPDEMEEPGEPCVPTAEFFAKKIWAPLMATECIACHNPQGAAKASKLVLQSSGWQGFLAHNLAVVEEVAAYDYQGESLLLVKPTAQVKHGGGEVVALNSAHYDNLVELIDRFKNPVECEAAPPTDEGFFDGVVLLDASATFRKAALALAGRLPTPDEEQLLAINGLAALPSLLDGLVAEDGFYERLRETWNDELLTDRYNRNQDALNLLNTDDYPDRKWFEDDDYPASAVTRNLGEKHTNEAVARAALNLIAHVVRNGRPFSEVLTADYVVVNAFGARALGGYESGIWTDPNDPTEMHEIQVDGLPHAGVMTDHMFLNRFPTTATNRNRNRSRMIWRFFLATDVLALAEQPIDPTQIVDHNPTLFNPQCTVCHDIVDPVAGAFQNWAANGRYQPPEEGWFGSMLPPGLGDESIPANQHGSSLGWLAERIGSDARFATSTVYFAFRMLTGAEPLSLPSELDGSIQSDEQLAARMAAYEQQSAELTAIAQELVGSDFDFRAVLKATVNSRWFRASHLEAPVDGMRAEELAGLGAVRLLTPEQLNRKIVSATGYPWRSNPTSRDFLLDSDAYRIFYGGHDSQSVLNRIADPNGIMGRVQQRMANEVACRAVAQDFAKLPHQRLLLPHVEVGYVPNDLNGFPIPQAQAAITDNLRHLHQHLLGERLLPDDPELLASYALWHDVWKDGLAALEAEEVGSNLHWECTAVHDWLTSTPYPPGQAVTADPRYTVRAWTAVVAYMLNDYRFLFE